MIPLQQILKTEERNEDNLFQIHLHRDGNWWRAYNWSAYLCQNYPKNPEVKPLKATHRQTNGTDVIFIGIQLDSFKKFLPGIEVKEDTINDNHMVFDVRDKFINQNITMDNCETIFQSWMEGYPIKDERKTSKNNKRNDIITDDIPFISSVPNRGLGRETIMSICADIVRYPYMERSPIEHSAYLKDIQRRITDLII